VALADQQAEEILLHPIHLFRLEGVGGRADRLAPRFAFPVPATWGRVADGVAWALAYDPSGDTTFSGFSIRFSEDRWMSVDFQDRHSKSIVVHAPPREISIACPAELCGRDEELQISVLAVTLEDGTEPPGRTLVHFRKVQPTVYEDHPWGTVGVHAGFETVGETAGGQVRFRAPRGRYRVWVQDDRAGLWGRTDIGVPVTAESVLVLHSAILCRGRIVVPPGYPLPQRCRLLFRSTRHLGRKEWLPVEEGVATVGPDGGFALRILPRQGVVAYRGTPPGHLTITVIAPEWRPWRQTVALGPRAVLDLGVVHLEQRWADRVDVLATADLTPDLLLHGTFDRGPAGGELWARDAVAVPAKGVIRLYFDEPVGRVFEPGRLCRFGRAAPPYLLLFHVRQDRVLEHVPLEDRAILLPAGCIGEGESLVAWWSVPDLPEIDIVRGDVASIRAIARAQGSAGDAPLLRIPFQAPAGELQVGWRVTRPGEEPDSRQVIHEGELTTTSVEALIPMF